jgi:SnoaL-like domain
VEELHRRGLEFSIGFPMEADVKAAILATPADGWLPAADQHGHQRPGAWVCELSTLDLSGWPPGTRAICRRERPHPGARHKMTFTDQHPDYVLEMPQSGERIRGRDNMQAYKGAYPNPPTIQLRRVVGVGDVWVVEARSDYGDGQTYHVIDIVEYRDNKIWRETRYYAQPFQAPHWRTQWVEPMEQAATPAGPTA